MKDIHIFKTKATNLNEFIFELVENCGELSFEDCTITSKSDEFNHNVFIYSDSEKEFIAVNL